MRQKRYRSGVVSGILLPLGMVCLFAFCALALALLGGRAYKQIQGNVDRSHGSSVAASYLRTKLSQNNSGGTILLEEQNGVQTLVITTDIQGRSFDTRIFMHEGQLVETFGPSGAEAGTAGGNLIANLSACTFALDEDGLFTAMLVGTDGTTARSAFALTEGGRL